jgi:hypothetical protein
MEAHKSESEAVATKPTLQGSPESAVKNDTSCSSNADVALNVEAPEKMTEADNTAIRDSTSSMDSPGDVNKRLDEAAINTIAASDESGRVDGSSQKVAAEIAKHENQDDNMVKNKGESEVSTVGETSEGQLNPTPSGNSVSVDNGSQKPIKSETEDDIGIDCHKIAQHFDKSDNPTDSTGVSLFLKRQSTIRLKMASSKPAPSPKQPMATWTRLQPTLRRSRQRAWTNPWLRRRV